MTKQVSEGADPNLCSEGGGGQTIIEQKYTQWARKTNLGGFVEKWSVRKPRRKKKVQGITEKKNSGDIYGE